MSVYRGGFHGAACVGPNSITLSRSQAWSQTQFLTRLPTSSCGSATSSRPVRDFFGSKAGRRQVRAISTCRDSSNLVADRIVAGFRPAFDRPATRTRHAHAGLRPGRRPGYLRLDSVIEFGLYLTKPSIFVVGIHNHDSDYTTKSTRPLTWRRQIVLFASLKCFCSLVSPSALRQQQQQ